MSKLVKNKHAMLKSPHSSCLILPVPVGSDAQVHLLGVGVGLEGLGDAEDRVGRAHLHAGEPGGPGEEAKRKIVMTVMDSSY